jgi:galactokinase
MTQGDDHAAADAARSAFERMFSTAAEGVAFAPGRVNLIGEHTDYNDGFVLPMAIEEGIGAAFARRSDDVLRVHASDFAETCEIDLAALDRSTEWRSGWIRYVAGVAWAMQSAGLSLVGADVAIAANLPAAVGLSSSAALELVMLRVLTAAGGIDWDPRLAAQLAQRAEHEFAGVACGIMDQMVVACARGGTALLLDCRSLETEHVPLPSSVRIVIMNTGVRRTLATSAYNERRASCERAVTAVRKVRPSVRALRDVDAPLLERARSTMDETTYRRASHVVAENARPQMVARALTSGDLVGVGRLMRESHNSLRDLYEVSCPELDTLVAASSAQTGCYGARLTGAGFGGCAIALVDADRVEPFSTEVSLAFKAAAGLETSIIVSKPASGVRLQGAGREA